MAREPFGRFLRLGYQHQKAVHGCDAPLFRVQKNLRSGGIEHHIQNPFQMGKLVQIYRGFPHIGIHSHRRGVDQNSGVGVEMQVVVVVLTGAGDDYHMGTGLLQHRHGSVGRAAAAQNQHFFAGNGQAACAEHGPEAEKVRIMSNQGTVRPADDGIHCAHLLRPVGQLI